MKQKVSFDYDGTLTRDEVKQYAIELLQRGISIDIHSRRSDDDHFPTQHDDILHFGGSLMKYSRNQAMVEVYLCGMDKVRKINESKAIWHLDDEAWEIDMINRKSNYGTVGIHYRVGDDFRSICELFLQQKPQGHAG
jgi:hypothetical protein